MNILRDLGDVFDFVFDVSFFGRKDDKLFGVFERETVYKKPVKITLSEMLDEEGEPIRISAQNFESALEKLWKIVEVPDGKEGCNILIVELNDVRAWEFDDQTWLYDIWNLVPLCDPFGAKTR